MEACIFEENNKRKKKKNTRDGVPAYSVARENKSFVFKRGSRCSIMIAFPPAFLFGFSPCGGPIISLHLLNHYQARVGFPYAEHAAPAPVPLLM